MINFQKLDQIEANLEKKEEKVFKLDSKRSLKMTSIPKNSQDSKTLADMVQSSKSSAIIAGVQVVNGLMLSQFELQASQGKIFGSFANILKKTLGEAQVKNAIYTSRAQYGIPDDVIVYCNFNQLYKLDPATMNSWCNILKRVPNSIVWVLKFPALGEKHVHDWIKK